jgi:hypothetical protein
MGGIMMTRMNPSARRSRLAPTRCIALAAAVLLASTQATFAVFIGPNVGSTAGITYAVENVNAAGGAVYDPVSGQLVNIGGLPGGAGYGSLGAPVTPVSAFGGGVAAPVAPLTPFGVSAAQPAVPALNFGDTIGGSARLAASTFAGGSGAGVFWFNPTFIADTGVDGRASVNFSRGIATFSDPTGDAAKIPGVALAVTGTLGGQGPAGAFVAATLFGRFSIFNAAGGLVNSFSTSVAIVSDGPGGRGDFVAFTPSVGGDRQFSNFLFPGANTFTAWGVDLLPSVAIPVGGSVTLDGTLSFVADPDVTLSFDIVPADVPLPDFGTFASIPEPASIVMMGLGLLATLGIRGKGSRG